MKWLEMVQPETAESSASLREKCSIANREASGDGGLLDGGVGKDEVGAAEDTRASSENEFGPSITRWANT
jgi:hypothetical protein